MRLILVTILLSLGLMAMTPEPQMKTAHGYMNWSVELGGTETLIYSPVFRYSAEGDSYCGNGVDDLEDEFRDDMRDEFPDLEPLSQGGITCNWDEEEIEEELGRMISHLRTLGTPELRRVRWDG